MTMTTSRGGSRSPSSGGQLSNPVVLELDGAADGDAIVLAVRRDGDLVELAERTAPATATIHGETE